MNNAFWEKEIGETNKLRNGNGDEWMCGECVCEYVICLFNVYVWDLIV